MNVIGETVVKYDIKTFYDFFFTENLFKRCMRTENVRRYVGISI